MLSDSDKMYEEAQRTAMVLSLGLSRGQCRNNLINLQFIEQKYPPASRIIKNVNKNVILFFSLNESVETENVPS